MAVVSVRFPNRRVMPQSAAAGRTTGLRDSRKPHAPRHHKLRLLMAGVALGVLVLVLASTFLRPPMATAIAGVLPASWIKTAATNTQNALDLTQLRPTQVPDARIEALSTQFAALTAPASGALPYRLLFRQGGQSGPLTYSLPDGSIIVTDELLAMLPDDAQVLALLCHELGHLHYHHMLQASIENQVFAIAAAGLLGLDQQVIHRLEVGIVNAELPDSAHYEADNFAQRMLAQNAIPPFALKTALEALAQHATATPAQAPLLRAPSAELFQNRMRYLPRSKG